MRLYALLDSEGSVTAYQSCTSLSKAAATARHHLNRRRALLQ
jgi:hypothetical protein